MLSRRVKSLAGHKAGQCNDEICVYEERRCNGIQRWRAQPYELEFYGEYHYSWYCEGRYARSEEDI